MTEDMYCCWKCFEQITSAYDLWDRLSFQRMILCPYCGNKRCPKATDHNLACTNSNEAGQKGSIYS